MVVEAMNLQRNAIGSFSVETHSCHHGCRRIRQGSHVSWPHSCPDDLISTVRDAFVNGYRYACRRSVHNLGYSRWNVVRLGIDRSRSKTPEVARAAENDSASDKQNGSMWVVGQLEIAVVMYRFSLGIKPGRAGRRPASSDGSKKFSSFALCVLDPFLCLARQGLGDRIPSLPLPRPPHTFNYESQERRCVKAIIFFFMEIHIGYARQFPIWFEL